MTLEPLLPSGTDSPCTEAILEQKIGRVVIGSRDPNPKVAGKGARLLREAGVIVEEDFMREVCDPVESGVFSLHYHKDAIRCFEICHDCGWKDRHQNRSFQVDYGEAARQKVQHMRHRYTGIMVGIGTVLADDPMLNTRDFRQTKPRSDHL